MNKWLIQFLTALVAGLTMCSYSMAADGDLDTSFGTGGKVTTDIGATTDTCRGVAIQSDWNIVVDGYCSPTTNYFALVRYENSPPAITLYIGY